MLKFISRHWHGNGNFWFGWLWFSLLLPLSIYWYGIQLVGVRTLHEPPRTRMMYAAAFMAIILVLGIWQLVGTWRGSSKAKAPGHWWITRWLARLVAVAVAATAFAIIIPLLGGMPMLYATANDRDWLGQQGYNLTTQSDRIIINGSFTWRLHDEFAQALANNRQLRTVVLTSPGGQLGVGLRIGDMIKARALDTLASELCASSCTLAFVAGNRRMLRSNTKLGFHGVAGDGDQLVRTGTELYVSHFRKAGVPDAFINRAVGTSPQSVWYPTIDELRRANIVTDVVR